MNHKLTYDSIIQNALILQKNRKNDDAYYERHHIIPKCLGGSDTKDNLVLLTAKEHFICHKLLTYIYPKNFKIYHAFHLLSVSNKHIIISSRDYEYAKLLKSFVMSNNNPSMNPEIAKKIQKSNTGKKRSEDSKQRYSVSKIGHIVNLETRIKISTSKRGKNTWMKNKKHSEKSIERMKISHKSRERRQCFYCGKIVDVSNFGRYHGNKCKMLN